MIIVKSKHKLVFYSSFYTNKNYAKLFDLDFGNVNDKAK
jgi:hypothetical protein